MQTLRLVSWCWGFLGRSVCVILSCVVLRGSVLMLQDVQTPPQLKCDTCSATPCSMGNQAQESTGQHPHKVGGHGQLHHTDKDYEAGNMACEVWKCLYLNCTIVSLPILKYCSKSIFFLYILQNVGSVSTGLTVPLAFLTKPVPPERNL